MDDGLLGITLRMPIRLRGRDDIFAIKKEDADAAVNSKAFITKNNIKNRLNLLYEE